MLTSAVWDGRDGFENAQTNNNPVELIFQYKVTVNHTGHCLKTWLGYVYFHPYMQSIPIANITL